MAVAVLTPHAHQSPASCSGRAGATLARGLGGGLGYGTWTFPIHPLYFPDAFSAFFYECSLLLVHNITEIGLTAFETIFEYVHTTGIRQEET